MQRLFHHPVLFQIQLQYGLLQISDTTMYEFCAPAGCATGEVIAFDEGGFKAARYGVKGTTSSCCSTAYDDDVKALGLERFELFIAGG